MKRIITAIVLVLLVVNLAVIVRVLALTHGQAVATAQANALADDLRDAIADQTSLRQRLAQTAHGWDLQAGFLDARSSAVQQRLALELLSIVDPPADHSGHVTDMVVRP